MKKLIIYVLSVATSVLVACGGASVPAEYQESAQLPTIYPDYIDVTVPVNMAPLSFEYDGEADEMVARYAVDDDDIVCNGQPTISEWRSCTESPRQGHHR